MLSGGLQVSDELPTVWQLEPHTKAKHAILISYLKAWAPILARRAKRLGLENTPLRFIDGFAGPGIYDKGEPGSPILALNAILDREVKLPAKVRFLFIEKDKERFESLEAQLVSPRLKVTETSPVDLIKSENSECEEYLVKWLDGCEARNEHPGPAFFFLDQFGYSHVSMDLVTRIMRHDLCEVFTYLNWARMNNYLDDKTKWSAIDAAFGGQEWRTVHDLPAGEKATHMREIYKAALRKNAKFSWSIAMCDKNNMLTHWLFFCTNNIRGLEVMKKAMWSVDETGCFQFSDKDNPAQFHLFEQYSDNHLASDIRDAFKGKTITVHQVHEFVLTETPAYLYKGALVLLERKNYLEPIDSLPKRKKGTFPDDEMSIRIL